MYICVIILHPGELAKSITVEPLLKDSPNKGHHRKYLPTKDTFLGPKNELPYSVNAFFTSEEWTTSLQWTN